MVSHTELLDTEDRQHVVDSGPDFIAFEETRVGLLAAEKVVEHGPPLRRWAHGEGNVLLVFSDERG